MISLCHSGERKFRFRRRDVGSSGLGLALSERFEELFDFCEPDRFREAPDVDLWLRSEPVELRLPFPFSLPVDVGVPWLEGTTKVFGPAVKTRELDELLVVLLLPGVDGEDADGILNSPIAIGGLGALAMVFKMHVWGVCDAKALCVGQTKERVGRGRWTKQTSGCWPDPAGIVD